MSCRQKKLFLLTFLSSLILLSCATQKHLKDQTAEGESAEELEIKLKVERKIFPNGLRVIVVENPRLPIFSFYTFYDVGARHEPLGQTGSSHFLEHLMFKGAKKYGPGAFFKEIESMGGSANASTDFDSTIYYQNLPKASLKQIIDMEADRMANLLLDEVEFEKEKNIILEERKKRFENSPYGQLFMLTGRHLYRNTPYGGTVIGEIPDIKNITRAEVKEHFENYYAPNNAVIAVAGDLKSEEVFDLIEKYYGHIPASKDLAEKKKRFDSREKYSFSPLESGHTQIHGQAPLPILAWVFPGAKKGSRKELLLNFLSSILASGRSSYFVESMVHSQNAPFTSFSAFSYPRKYSGAFYLYGELLSAKGIASANTLLQKELGRACEKSINERSLEKTKNLVLLGFFSSIENNSGLAQTFGQGEAFFGDPFYYKNELKTYLEISTDELRKTCNELLSGPSRFFSVWNRHPQK